MNHSICRIDKIKASGVTGIQIHDRREKNGISHTNKDIDWNKTNENINLLEQPEKFRTVVSNRIAELNLERMRCDATVMCQALITSEKEFFNEMNQQEKLVFFEKSLVFIKERYGEKNLVSATIHYDERTPHMHVNFVPVTKDGRLSAKDLFSPKSLRVLQDDYNRYVREQGYDLERGDIGSKRKHLKVEEYKIETKYHELKEKEKEIEKLERTDTISELKAEKGKLTYSTKEVDAIKEQNRALKFEGRKKDNEITELKQDLDKVNRRLVQAQKNLKGTEQSMERLKDLESENRALQEFRKDNLDLDESMINFDRLKEYAYSVGETMVKCKEIYFNAQNDRESLINRSNVCEKMARDCDNKTTDLKSLERDISASLEQETALKIELEGLKGIFKKKAREDCTNRLEQQESFTQGLTDRLQKDHGIEPKYIVRKIESYAEEKKGFLKEKAEIMAQTDKVEQLGQQAVYKFKWHKALSDCQKDNLRDISNRIVTRARTSPNDDKIFRITHADRQQLLKDFVGKVEPKTIEKCKHVFEKQDEAKHFAQSIAHSVVQSKGIER